jgi:hypothetical protein
LLLQVSGLYREQNKFILRINHILQSCRTGAGGNPAFIINMADIFSVTAPLKIRLPNGSRKVVAELFRHPKGLLYFDLFWHEDRDSRIHLLEGELSGEGPWKIADHIFYVLGCRGTDADLAGEYAEWQTWRMHNADTYPDKQMIDQLASSYGAMDAD